MNFDNEFIGNAEMSVIGAIIIDETSLARIVDKIRVDDFSCDELKEIYK